VQDPFEKNVPGRGLGRDPERTPMQWDGSPGAGFSEAEPWLPLADDSAEVNVEAQRDDPRSMLSFSRRLLALRRGSPALEVGSFRSVTAQGDVLAYLRRGREGEDSFLVALNLGSTPHEVSVPGELTGTVAVSTHLEREGERVEGPIRLGPDEGLVIRILNAEF
jgi:alpha-glucosidase